MKAGIPTGPLEISEPCLGYPFVWLLSILLIKSFS